MNINTSFVAFGEIAVDYVYDDESVLKIDGGISAYNTLYYLACMGNNCIALGGTGFDKAGVVMTGAKQSSNTESIIENTVDGKDYFQAHIAMQSLKDVGVECSNIQYLNKTINFFFINHNSKNVKIGRFNPGTGESSITWSDEISPDIPEQIQNSNVVAVVSNFEQVTKAFVTRVKQSRNGSDKQFPIASMDITNNNIFDKYPISYLNEFLGNIDLIQCSENTLKLLIEKYSRELGRSISEEEFVAMTNAKLFTLTKGKDGATFYYRDEEGHYVSHSFTPAKVIYNEVDATGAGDSFHAKVLQGYVEAIKNRYTLDNVFFSKLFNEANSLSRAVVLQIGARIPKKDVLDALDFESISL